MREVRLVNLTREAVLAERAAVAETPRARNRGLLGTDSLADGCGLLIVPCRQVHTFGMRFPIDVAVCDADLVVLRTRRLPPGRMTLPMRRGRQVIEAEAGAFARWGLVAGDQLDVRP